MPREAHGERAQAAQAEEAVVARRRDAHVGPEPVQRREGRGIGNDQSQQHVGVAAEVLGRRMHRDVDAVLERAEENGVAHVLSSTTFAPRACATAAMAGTSCTSNVSDPGDSVNTMRVFGWNSRSIAAPASGS